MTDATEADRHREKMAKRKAVQDAEVAQRFLFDHAEVTRRARAALDAPDPQRVGV